VGNFLLSLGLVVASGARPAVFVPLYLAFFAGQYHFIVRWEESVLAEEFGAAYAAYREAIPRWLARPWLFQSGPIDLGAALRAEWPTFLAIASAWTALFALRAGLAGTTLWAWLVG
jgi:hypothetical protein